MKNYFDEARNYGKSNERIMNKFLKIVEKNSLQAKIVYWK